MQELFSQLSHAIEGTAAIAIAAAFLWGILSIVLSPCHLASIPLIIGFIDNQGSITARRAFAISSLFAVGILITTGIIGAITAAAGRMLGSVGAWANYLVAAVFFVVGLHLLGIIPMPFGGPGSVGMQRKGMLAALILGLVFGIALGPCTFAYMAPMLGVTFKLAATSMVYGIVLLVAYGVGHCRPYRALTTETTIMWWWSRTQGGARRRSNNTPPVLPWAIFRHPFGVRSPTAFVVQQPQPLWPTGLAGTAHRTHCVPAGRTATTTATTTTATTTATTTTTATDTFDLRLGLGNSYGNNHSNGHNHGNGSGRKQQWARREWWAWLTLREAPLGLGQRHWL